MILADVIPAELNFAINVGALGILGYHLLWGLPRIINDINDVQLKVAAMFMENTKHERESADERVVAIVDEIARLRDALPGGCPIAKAKEERIRLHPGKLAQDD